jgi:hypothetical protein
VEEATLGPYLWCVPDPSDPNREICEEILVEIEPPRLIPDPKIGLKIVPEELRTDIAVLVGIDQLAAGMQDSQLGLQLVEAVDGMVAQLAEKLPSDLVIKRADSSAR